MTNALHPSAVVSDLACAYPIHPTRTDAVTLLHTKNTPAITLAWAAEPPHVPDGADANTLPWRMIYICHLGTQSALKQVRANWRLRSTDRKPVIHRAPTDQVAVRVPLTRAGDQRNVYRMFGGPLADAYPYLHYVDVHQAVLNPQCGEVCYHLAPLSGEPDLALFGQQLGKALVLPIDPTRLAAIWAAGRTHGLITPLRSWGCQGYRIDATNPHAWAAALSTVLGGSGTLTVIGPPTLDPDLIDLADLDPADPTADDHDDDDLD